MKWWPWRRRDSEEIAEARGHLDRLDQQQPEVTRLTRELLQAEQRNGFADAVRAAMRGAS